MLRLRWNGLGREGGFERYSMNEYCFTLTRINAITCIYAHLIHETQVPKSSWFVTSEHDWTEACWKELGLQPENLFEMPQLACPYVTNDVLFADNMSSISCHWHHVALPIPRLAKSCTL